MTNIAVILAAGSGKRAGGDIPKQFMPLANGLTVMETAVAAFEQAELIDEIFIVANKCYFDTILSYSEKRNWQKLSGLIEGGRERWESSYNAIEKIRLHLQNTNRKDCNILLHDCARPFVSLSIITAVCSSLSAHEAVTVALPVTDTVYVCEKDCDTKRLVAIPARESLLRAQTPQAFRLSVISEAYRRAVEAGYTQATDDCGILHRFIPEVKIAIVDGEEENRKITYKQDLQTGQ